MVPTDASEMDLATKVGQLFVVGFDGTELTADLRTLITERQCGNVVYFSRNVETPTQVATLTDRLRRLVLEEGPGVPPFVMADQEGGVVSRLGWGTELPSQMCIGASGDPTLARTAGEAVAGELAALGINFNLAPVLDVNNNPRNPVIGVRSFGEDPERVGELGVELALGMQSRGVIACGKHFPGHGDTSADSHHELPVVDHDRERLADVEFAPFRRAIDAGLDAIMTTHVSFPAITETPSTPATVSAAVQRRVLRDELGFDGLLVTDGMEMRAIADGVGTPEGCVRALEAGCDLLLVCHTPETQADAIDAVIDAVESGRLDEATIDTAVDRILRYKRRRVSDSRSPSAPPWADAADRSAETARAIAARGITLARDRDDTLPFTTDRPLRLVGSSGGPASPAEDDEFEPSLLAESLATVGFDVTCHEFDDPLEGPSFDDDAQVIAAVDDATADESQAAAVGALDDRTSRFAAVLVRNPYDLSTVPDVSTAVVTYDYTPATRTVLGEMLVGETTPTGQLPVTVPGFAD
ncbi:beta-N-acetylhexosaminidase [Natrinema longum]|uniref:Beta-N-acetylhexosaminidase n=1 Tax=Natrinema longum TaxID=370324 RepID=A0A8A2U3V3_9EURY|nr:beta-N-acetylhexosaminidase [Natrinema longum]MBZ6495070.1 beta-N-acetylhexosaminidase [Natrinema longum]QSW83636.1 beta-N-acetylhexosaminidase [Natrinema longum]